MLLTLNFKVYVKLPATFINKPKKTIDDNILNHLQHKYGNKCYLNHGYVFKSSITLINRSRGILDNLIVDGGIIYNVEFAANICKPKEDDIINSVIIQKNKECIGCEAVSEFKHILEIIVPVSWHEPDQIKELKKLNVDNVIAVKVIGTRFEPLSTKIRTICSYVKTL